MIKVLITLGFAVVPLSMPLSADAQYGYKQYTPTYQQPNYQIQAQQQRQQQQTNFNTMRINSLQSDQNMQLMRDAMRDAYKSPSQY